MRRATVSIAVLGLVAAQFISNSGASAATSCRPFRPKAPASLSSNAAEAPKEDVVLVSDKATEDKPIVIAYEHGPGFADSSLGEAAGNPRAGMILEDAHFFNFQVVASAKQSAVNARIEWGSPSVSDIDLRLYGQTGGELDYSSTYNPVQDVYGMAFGGDDANGMEQLLGVWMTRCSGFTIESRPSSSPGEDAVTLKVWLD